MKNLKSRRRIAIIIIATVILALGLGSWWWFQPHRDIRSASPDEAVQVNELTRAFISDPSSANAHYLSRDGNSKILLLTGPVYNISTNNAGEPVVLIKDDTAKMGVMATFFKDNSKEVQQLTKGMLIRVKGVITAGNSYDADLDLYDHATLIQCVLLPLH
ncbi:MAG: hypothetical protein KGO82_02200 [Bacteroidota bacterium]|nr:hypothetical protein [Bacteroidota bacterium]